MDEESPDDILHSHPIERGEKDISWINEVRSYLNSKQPMEHPYFACTIFRVPEHIRQLDREACTPRVAFLGPFHHHNPYEGSAMQDYKWRCVRHLLSRHGSPEHASHLLDKCLLELKKQNKRVRSCYSEEFSALNDQEMALIMLLDGCFIIRLLLRMRARTKLQEEKIEEEEEEEETEEEEEEEALLNEEIERGETEEEKVGKSKGKATEEDEGKKRRGCTTETREGEVVLNIGEEVEQLEVPTVAGLFIFSLVVRDLLKLENQIPFFIIQLLFDHLKTSKDENIDLVDLALQLFEGIPLKESESFKEKKNESPRKYHHLLHLFYLSRVPSKNPAESTSAPGRIRHAIEWIKSKCKKTEAAPSQGASTSAPSSTCAPGCIPGIIEHMKSKWKKAETSPSQGTSTSAPKWIPSATELHRAGVKFKRKKSADSFLNITFAQRKMNLMPLQCLCNLCLKFSSGWMEIPQLQIYDHTGPLFKNLVAFEQCYFDTKMYITIYTIFMDYLIDQTEDVRFLHFNDILEHGLSSDQAVAELFNQLGNQIFFSWEKNYLANQINEVNKFCDFRWHRWLAALRRDYLDNPWTTISVLAAIFLLLLTMEQAVFSALSYFHHS